MKTCILFIMSSIAMLNCDLFSQPIIQSSQLSTSDLTFADQILYSSFCNMEDVESCQLILIGSPQLLSGADGVSTNLNGNNINWRTKEFKFINSQDYFWLGEEIDSNGNPKESYFFLQKKTEITVGEISFSDHFYKIYSINDHDQVLLEYDTENEDHSKICGNQDGENIPYQNPEACESSSCLIKVLMMYTAAVAAKYSHQQLLNFSYGLIAQTQTAMIRSDVHHTLELVAVAPTTYFTEKSSDLGLQLSEVNFAALQSGNDISQNLRAYAADVVTVLCDEKVWGSAQYGIAAVPASKTTGMASLNAITQSLNSQKSYSHEFGHLMNARHTNDNRALPGRAYDFIINSKHVATLLDNQFLPRILNYSNPNIMYYGNIATGVSDRFNVCNMWSHGCIVGSIFPEDGCQYNLTGTLEGICPTILTQLVVNKDQSSSNNCQIIEVLFESSIDGIHFTEIQRGSSNICTPNLPIGSILYIRVKVTSILNNIYKYNTIFKRFQSKCPIIAVPAPGRTAQANLDLDFSIYPNPVNDEIMINTNISTEITAHIEIQNAQGQVLKSMKLNLSKTNKINIAEIPSGSYFLIINNAINQKILNFVKINE